MSKEYYVLDEGKLQEYEEDFITFNDYLPLLLRESVYFKYINHIRKNGDYDKVIKECVEHRPLNYNQSINELKEWLKHHKEYNDVLITLNQKKS